ncbi:TPA: hypothetical protein N2D10_003134 [Clostridium botulinum]|nr:hypothetical protein [Clostridium botulinum]
MVSKEMYLKGIRCKGICEFCEDTDGCYQYAENAKSDIEIRVFNHKTNKVAYKVLSKSEANLLLDNIELKWT